MKLIIILSFLVLIFSCDPFVNEFSDIGKASMYKASNLPDTLLVYSSGAPIKVVTWNIRFGSGRFPFFGDSCGDEVIADNQLVDNNMRAIADKLNELDADIVLLQEVDISSKRTGYMDQVQYLLNNTSLNYGSYASMWEADFIPTDGIGKINTGNAILSKYELTEAERIQLRLRTDQDNLVQYFYLRRNILKVKIPSLSQDGKDFFAVDIHATAFATDDTKEQHINKYTEVLSSIVAEDAIFISGGDLNSVPPGSGFDFCSFDKCDTERYENPDGTEVEYHSIDSVSGPHKEGSFFNNFDGEPDILSDLYSNYQPAIDHDGGLSLLPEHFTHAPSTSMLDDTTVTKYDRKLDYLFTNGSWVSGSGFTHQEVWDLSDHMPVSASFLPEEN